MKTLATAESQNQKNIAKINQNIERIKSVSRSNWFIKSRLIMEIRTRSAVLFCKIIPASLCKIYPLK